MRDLARPAGRMGISLQVVFPNHDEALVFSLLTAFELSGPGVSSARFAARTRRRSVPVAENAIVGSPAGANEVHHALGTCDVWRSIVKSSAS